MSTTRELDTIAADICAAEYRCAGHNCSDCGEWEHWYDEIDGCKIKHDLYDATKPNGTRKDGTECAPEDCGVNCQEWRL